MSMSLRDAMNRFSGLKYVADSLEILSATGKRILDGQKWLTHIDEIKEIQTLNQEFFLWFSAYKNSREFAELEHILMRLHDITSTLTNLEKGTILDDIEFFEIKLLAILSIEARNIFNHTNLSLISLPDLQNVLSILDPENSVTPYFYIYDSYNPELASLRKEIKSMEADSDSVTEILTKIFEEESKVRITLSSKLRPFVNDLKETLNSLGYLDILIAKSKLNERLNLSCPIIKTEGDIFWKRLFNPSIRDVLIKKRKKFQPQDVRIIPGDTLLSGVNMGGKSILLKSLAVGQLMVQFGFFVPADYCETIPVEDVFLCDGDDQSEKDGLSSFAAEMLKINQVVQLAKSNKRFLIFIDEPARTTNPEEGKSLVASLLSFFASRPSFSVITTHYSGLEASRKIRIAGLSKIDLPEIATLDDISRLMDYSILEVNDEDVPREAISVARMLGMDAIILDEAEKRLGLKIKKIKNDII